MMQIFKLLSLSLTSLTPLGSLIPVVASNCSQTTNIKLSSEDNQINFSNILKQINGRKYQQDVKLGTKKKEFIFFLEYFSLVEFFDSSVQENLSIDMMKESMKWLLSNKNRQIFNWEENQKTWQEITNNQDWLDSTTKENEKISLKLTFKEDKNEFNMFFNFSTVEKSKDEIQVLTERFDFTTSFFTWHFSRVTNSQSYLYNDNDFTIVNIDQFKEGVSETFKLLFSISAFSFLKNDTLKVVNIRNNGNILKKEDLKKPGQLNLTVDYQYLTINNEIVNGTNKFPMRINLTE